MEMNQYQIKSLLYLVDVLNENIRDALKFECQGLDRLSMIHKLKAEAIRELINELGYSKYVKDRVNMLKILRYAAEGDDVQTED